MRLAAVTRLGATWVALLSSRRAPAHGAGAAGCRGFYGVCNMTLMAHARIACGGCFTFSISSRLFCCTCFSVPPPSYVLGAPGNPATKPLNGAPPALYMQLSTLLAGGAALWRRSFTAAATSTGGSRAEQWVAAAQVKEEEHGTGVPIAVFTKARRDGDGMSVGRGSCNSRFSSGTRRVP